MELSREFATVLQVIHFFLKWSYWSEAPWVIPTSRQVCFSLHEASLVFYFTAPKPGDPNFRLYSENHLKLF